MGPSRPLEKTVLSADIVGFNDLMADDLEAATAAVTELRALVARGLPPEEEPSHLPWSGILRRDLRPRQISSYSG